MASDRASLLALRELIADTDLTLETIPDLPQNRTAHCRENLRAAKGYIEACCSPVAVEFDGECEMFGGHIHVATITPQKGFRWIIAPI